MLSSGQCVPKGCDDAAKQGEWRTVWDTKLAKAVGGQPITQSDLSELKALTLNFQCGPKSSFGSEGGPSKAPTSFKQCLKEGVASNAALKSQEPWRLYHPEEVIVVAAFGTLKDASCLSTNPQTEGKVCGGATKQDDIDAHWGSDGKMSTFGGEYRGMRTGQGLPKGTVKEVVLRPEDVLEVNGLLL